PKPCTGRAMWRSPWRRSIARRARAAAADRRPPRRRCTAGRPRYTAIPVRRDTRGIAMRARSRLTCLIAVLCATAIPTAWSVTDQSTIRPYHRVPARDELTPEQKKAETFVAKLFGRARAATAQNNYAAAAQAYDDALRVLEEAYGPDSERITEALH